MMEPRLKHAARIDAAIWTPVICVVERVDASGARVSLERWRPQDTSVSCEGGSKPW